MMQMHELCYTFAVHYAVVVLCNSSILLSGVLSFLIKNIDLIFTAIYFLNVIRSFVLFFCWALFPLWGLEEGSDAYSRVHPWKNLQKGPIWMFRGLAWTKNPLRSSPVPYRLSYRSDNMVTK